MDQKTFGVAINCMDGRVQLPVIDFLKKKFGLDYVDAVTEPGPNKIVAENRDYATIESIKRRVAISVEKHGAKIVALVAHFDCAGNPADKTVQLDQLNQAEEVVKSWGFNTRIVKLWVDEKWQVHLVQ
ncbi:MAG: hypothetical protein K6T77_02110 [candidate division WOR-3 bacterium]|jgi:carbonic anhydrase|nr:hypothetical protein [candidate division WOR-3 bacterium]MDH7519520.1 hypothetical protein [bacterium]